MGDSAKPEDFFLPPKDESNDVTFLPPHRQGNKIEPLVDGEAFFTAVEEAMANAKAAIYCAFWSIYPDTPLLSKKVKTSLKVKDWQGLLTTMAKKKKVQVRILTSDFDPILDNSHHRRAWKGYNTFVATAVKAGLTRDYFQVFTSLHPASFAMASLLGFFAKNALQGTITDLNKAKLKGLEHTPGIWPFVTVKRGKLTMIDSPSFVISPASHHQKIVVIDGTLGFVGGINVSSSYVANPAHEKNQRTHDIFCRVKGPVVEDIERNFVGRWNSESAAFTTFVTTVNAVKLKSQKIKVPLTISTLTMSKATLGKQGNAIAQMHRTVSTGVSGSFPSLTATVARDDIRRTYEQAISLANDYIYIENQYVRVVPVADAIIKRFKANQTLQVIIVVPVMPEEIEEGAGDPVTLHGVFLQHETLTKLRTALGVNLGLYSLVQKAKAPADTKSQGLSSFGSLRIYPHSKVLIVDDVFASIGSANVNPRSFELDSEMDLGWHEAASVEAFRKQLWKEHLGSADGSLFATWKAADFVKEWDAIAKRNTTASPTRRQGFIVPHDPDAAKGSQGTFPDFLAGLGAPTREDADTHVA